MAVNQTNFTTGASGVILNQGGYVYNTTNVSDIGLSINLCMQGTANASVLVPSLAGGSVEQVLNDNWNIEVPLGAGTVSFGGLSPLMAQFQGFAMELGFFLN